MTEIRLVSVGEGGVGKSSFIHSFITGKFTEEYDPTIEDSHRIQIEVDGYIHMLDILDTAGQEDLSAMQGEWFRSGEGFLLIYAINERKTFDQVQKLHARLDMVNHSRNVAKIVCGNKVDLANHREISIEEGKAFADEIKCPFLETSVKTRENVTEALMSLVREVHRSRKLRGVKIGSKEEKEGKKKKDKGWFSKKRQSCVLY